MNLAPYKTKYPDIWDPNKLDLKFTDLGANVYFTTIPGLSAGGKEIEVYMLLSANTRWLITDAKGIVDGDYGNVDLEWEATIIASLSIDLGIIVDTFPDNILNFSIDVTIGRDDSFEAIIRMAVFIKELVEAVSKQ